jgi:hypothetical protein
VERADALEERRVLRHDATDEALVCAARAHDGIGRDHAGPARRRVSVDHRVDRIRRRAGTHAETRSVDHERSQAFLVGRSAVCDERLADALRQLEAAGVHSHDRDAQQQRHQRRSNAAPLHGQGR